MIEQLTDPLAITAFIVGSITIALMLIANRQNNKKPPKSPE